MNTTNTPRRTGGEARRGRQRHIRRPLLWLALTLCNATVSGAAAPHQLFDGVLQSHVRNGRLQIDHLPYDWSLNGKRPQNLRN